MEGATRLLDLTPRRSPLLLTTACAFTYCPARAGRPLRSRAGSRAGTTPRAWQPAPGLERSPGTPSTAGRGPARSHSRPRSLRGRAAGPGPARSHSRPRPLRGRAPGPGLCAVTRPAAAGWPGLCAVTWPAADRWRGASSRLSGGRWQVACLHRAAWAADSTRPHMLTEDVLPLLDVGRQRDQPRTDRRCDLSCRLGHPRDRTCRSAGSTGHRRGRKHHRRGIDRTRRSIHLSRCSIRRARCSGSFARWSGSFAWCRRIAEFRADRAGSRIAASSTADPADPAGSAGLADPAAVLVG
jgi:hypothetical protein